MEHIKELKGIDFTVINREMSEGEKRQLSEYIKKRKKEIRGKGINKELA